MGVKAPKTEDVVENAPPLPEGDVDVAGGMSVAVVEQKEAERSWSAIEPEMIGVEDSSMMQRDYDRCGIAGH